MKKTSIEEKAKAYDEAFKRAKEAKQNTESAVTIGILEEIFPELKEESEDERIRQEIIDSIKRSMEDMSDSTKVIYNSWLNWLEKQRE